MLVTAPLQNNISIRQKRGHENCPAARVVDKFGGAANVAAIIGRNPSSVHRWSWSIQDGGTGGLVPARAQALLMEAARVRGIPLRANDFTHQTGERLL